MNNRSPKRIAFIVDTFPSVSETFILNQIIYLRNRNYHVGVFAKNKGQFLHEDLIESSLIDEIRYYQNIPKKTYYRLKKIIQFIINNYSLLHFFNLFKCFNFFKIKKSSISLYYHTLYTCIYELYDYDIIHAQFGHNGALISQFKSLGIFHDIPLITTFHGYDMILGNIKFYNKFYKSLFKYGDLFTVNSKYSIEILEKIKGNVERVKLLPMGVNTDYFHPSYNKNKNDFIRILFVGRLIKLKGVDNLLSIVTELLNKNIQNFELLVVGDGPERDRMEKEIFNKKLGNTVKILGAQSQSKLIEFYSLSDVFLFPGIMDPNTNRAETQGLVVQEAQAMKLPVIVSNVGGVKYGMKHGVTGFVIGEMNIYEYVETIEKLMKSPNLRRNIGEKGREFVCDKFDIKVLGEKLEKLYKSVY
ncbi:glycosyltransferase family 4 protein [Echinicola shivajiensis]|uniref:glycosyltransferase family 4 protein n=1 Tax=Echinicola shivajiensis TaxID=1035916 RepID=UPI001BFC9685|nr:glycosyltransferase family 4 protein [Echinicola shivajiensis]